MPIRRPPHKTSKILLTIQKEAKRQNVTAYAIAQSTGIAINTIRRILNSEGSPTLATIELVADALGMELGLKHK